MVRQEVIQLIERLPDDKFALLVKYIRMLLRPDTDQNGESSLVGGQERLLGFLDYTISTGRGDFAENHDHYIHGTPGFQVLPY